MAGSFLLPSLGLGVASSPGPHLQDEQHLDDGWGRPSRAQQQQVAQLHLQQDQVTETQQGDLADGQLLALGVGGERAVSGWGALPGPATSHTGAVKEVKMWATGPAYITHW